MKINCSVYIATSLDGFIAKPDGNIEWLHDPSFTIEGEDFGYSDYMGSIDALIMGRNTFEQVLTFGDWPYQKPVIVLSSKSLNITEELEEKVHLTGGSPVEILDWATKKFGYKSFYIDGGTTIQRFLSASLIDQLTITKIPVILGQGIPLFDKIANDLRLELIDLIKFENGFVQLIYQPKYK
ncbi:MAG: dihydrofolate reductase [Balneolaceae bacterium]|nr:dihydrofolate reductase [Balneolaceae bacterium]MBO6546837.1 dihydrofolate reductase [Balneolaceae bacterium]MBO6649197.1 dihydrofolate reductase [Balneolaceae bacterium]